MKNILKENMRRFKTKNLNEQNYPDFMLHSDSPRENIVAVISEFRLYRHDDANDLSNWLKAMVGFSPDLKFYAFMKFKVVDRVQGFDKAYGRKPLKYYLHKKDGTPFFEDSYDKQFYIFQEHQLDPKAGKSFQDHGYILNGSSPYGLDEYEARELENNPNQLIWLSKTPNHKAEIVTFPED